MRRSVQAAKSAERERGQMKEQAKRGKMAGGGAILEFGELRERNKQGAYLLISG